MAEETIEGKLDRVVWQKDEDRFFIFRVSTGSGLVTAKGVVPSGEPIPGLYVKLRGEWTSHPKHGRSFKFKRFGLGTTTTVEGLTRVLECGVRGIGPVTARAIVNRFGTDTIDVITKEPERLLEMEEFQSDAGRRKWERVIAKWKGFHEEMRVSAFLMGRGLGQALTKRVIERYGDRTVEMVQENPYVLLDVPGVGFKLADRVAFSLGITPDAPQRIEASIYHVLNRLGAQSGHLFLSRDDLFAGIRKITKLSVRGFGRDLMDDEVHETCLRMSRETFRPYFCQLVIDGPRIYTAQRYRFEAESASKLAQLMWAEVPIQYDDERLETFVREYESSEGITLSKEQRAGLRCALDSKVMLLTGLPGTGKTTLLKAIMQLFRSFRIHVAMLAPTGIAAKRMAQVVERPASTIHRCLQFNGSEWHRNQRKPLVVDAVIVDESSMVDQEILYRLLDALPDTTRLLLVGDPAQLPSVGPGNVLHQLMESGEIPHVHLTEIFRQAEASDIVTNSHRITNGQLPLFVNGRGKDFHFFELPDAERIYERLVRAAKALHDKGTNFHVVAAKHAGDLGVTALNELLKEELNPPSDFGAGKPEAKVSKHKEFRVGDKVMVTVNNYDLRIFNGDMAVISEITNGREKTVKFYVDIMDEDSWKPKATLITLTYPEAAEMLQLAFCTTVHKMQGLEADVILMPFVKDYGIMLQRNLFYTAVTRARRKVLIFGEWRAVRRAVNNSRVDERNTLLSSRLRDEVVMLGGELGDDAQLVGLV